MSEPPIDKIVSAREHSKLGAEATEQLQDYSAALRTIRSARGVFLLILMLSLVLHLGAYSAARWADVLTPLPELQKQLASPTDESAVGVVPDAEAAAAFSTWYYLIELGLPTAEFLGQASCGLLTLSFLFAALVCLSGGLGGVRGSISAFFWLLVLLALLFPWGRWLGGAAGSTQVPGVYYAFGELCNLPVEFGRTIDAVLHYIRFLGYPVLALLIAYTGDRRFTRGYRLVQRHLESRLNVKKI